MSLGCLPSVVLFFLVFFLWGPLALTSGWIWEQAKWCFSLVVHYSCTWQPLWKTCNFNLEMFLEYTSPPPRPPPPPPGGRKTTAEHIIPHKPCMLCSGRILNLRSLGSFFRATDGKWLHGFLEISCLEGGPQFQGFTYSLLECTIFSF